MGDDDKDQGERKPGSGGQTLRPPSVPRAKKSPHTRTQLGMPVAGSASAPGSRTPASEPPFRGRFDDEVTIKAKIPTELVQMAHRPSVPPTAPQEPRDGTERQVFAAQDQPSPLGKRTQIGYGVGASGRPPGTPAQGTMPMPVLGQAGAGAGQPKRPAPQQTLARAPAPATPSPASGTRPMPGVAASTPPPAAGSVPPARPSQPTLRERASTAETRPSQPVQPGRASQRPTPVSDRPQGSTGQPPRPGKRPAGTSESMPRLFLSVEDGARDGGMGADPRPPTNEVPRLQLDESDHLPTREGSAKSTGIMVGALLLVAIVGIGAWLGLRSGAEDPGATASPPTTTPVAPSEAAPSTPAQAEADTTPPADTTDTAAKKPAALGKPESEDSAKPVASKQSAAKRSEKKDDEKRARERKAANDKAAARAKPRAQRKPRKPAVQAPAHDEETARSIAGARDSLKALEGLPPPEDDDDEPVVKLRPVDEESAPAPKAPPPPDSDPVLRVTPAPDAPPMPD